MTDENMDRAKALAAKLEKKAKDALVPIEHEMEIMKWPEEYRTIMWLAIAAEAQKRAGMV